MVGSPQPGGARPHPIPQSNEGDLRGRRDDAREHVGTLWAVYWLPVDDGLPSFLRFKEYPWAASSRSHWAGLEEMLSEGVAGSVGRPPRVSVTRGSSGIVSWATTATSAVAAEMVTKELRDHSIEPGSVVWRARYAAASARRATSSLDRIDET